MAKEGFDYKVHYRNPKDGKVIKKNPYRLRITKKDGRVLERPPGSGNFFHEDGTAIKKVVSAKKPVIAPAVASATRKVSVPAFEAKKEESKEVKELPKGA